MTVINDAGVFYLVLFMFFILLINIFSFYVLWFQCFVYVSMCCLRGVINDNNNNK